MIGEKIEGYEIVRSIGTGGMGQVFECVHEVDGSRAAIKLLDSKLAEDPQVVARFFNEARAASLVDHPGVVRVIQAGTHPSGVNFIIMELLEGESLRTRLDEGRWTLRDLRLIRQIASALIAVHDKQLLHRDVTPGNIFIVRDSEIPGGEQAKLIDFGFAKLATEHYQGDETVVATHLDRMLRLGTPVYMSPEQCSGAADIDAKSDVYALGAVLYRLISRSPLFDDENRIEILKKHINQPPESLGKRVPGLPAALVGLVDSMVRKDRHARPTMAEVAAALDEIVAALPSEPAQPPATRLLLPPPPTVWARPPAIQVDRPRARRWPALVLMTGVAFAAGWLMHLLFLRS